MNNQAEALRTARENIKKAFYEGFASYGSACVSMISDDDAWKESDSKKTYDLLAAPVPQAHTVAVHITEALSYHAFERNDLTLAAAVEVIRHGWKRVAGRTERQLVLQIAGLLADAQVALTVAVPEGYKLLKDTSQEDRSWPDDATGENGSYYNTCHDCLRVFIGHKRRCICRVCSAPSQIADVIRSHKDNSQVTGNAK